MTFKAKYLRIQELVLDINQNTEYAAFSSVSGHVNWLDIKVTESKENYTSKFVEIDFLELEENDRSLKRLDKAIETLEHVLDGTIKPSVIGEEREVIRHKYQVVSI